MTNSIEKYLKKNGPSLSSEISEFLVNIYKISPAAARQRVSRGSKSILRLELSFPRRAKFLFLKEQLGTEKYWWRLEQALLDTNSAYGYAISALRERDGIIPKYHFEIVCGSPIRQKKHLSASLVLSRLISLQLIKIIHVDDVGECVYLGLHTNHIQSLIPAMKARLFVEELILRGIHSWLRKLGFVSYNQGKTRQLEENPKISTTAWDLAGPSYLSPLVNFKSGNSKPTPGFVGCDILLTNEVSERGIQPFLRKLSALQNLRNIDRPLCFFVANSFEKNAFNKLKSLGVSPATTSTIFDNDIGKGLTVLIEVLTRSVSQSVSLEKIDSLFKSLGKIEGASNRLRGALLEFVIAEIMRLNHGQYVQLNRICQTQKGMKEADIISVSNQQVRFTEGKGYNLNKKVTLDEVNYWLNEQVPVFRAFALGHPDWKDKNLLFEFWTTSSFEPDALTRLKRAKKITKKYQIDYKDCDGVTNEIKATNHKSLIKTYNDHFVNSPSLTV